MSRLSDIASSPMIKEFAVGAAQQAVAPVADFIAPPVNVSTPVGRYKVYTSKNRFKIPDTIRPDGGRAVELGWTAKDATYNCAFNAIDYEVPAVILIYEQNNSVNGTQQQCVTVDKWPADATGREIGAVLQTLQLEGWQQMIQRSGGGAGVAVETRSHLSVAGESLGPRSEVRELHHQHGHPPAQQHGCALRTD